MTGPLHRCPVKGCPWRGPDPDACPMHEQPGRSQIRKLMMPGDVGHQRSNQHRS